MFDMSAYLAIEGNNLVERVLIVAKTHMEKDLACVSGLTRQSNRSIRLLTARGSHQPADTHFEVGQVWEIEFKRARRITPPHVEDVQVIREKYIGRQSDIRETLLGRVQPWQGEPERLYDGLLSFGDNCAAYISRGNGQLPPCSTGYWLPAQSLKLTHIDDRTYYLIDYAFEQIGKPFAGTLRIRYIGFAEPIAEIAAQTLVRVSLARWWRLRPDDEERCYLQLSGWYM
jgi:hypothetical protein